MCLKLRITLFLRNSAFFSNKKIIIYLFIYFFLFIYTFRLCLRNLIRAELKEFGDLQNQILVILKIFSAHKGIYTREIKLI